MPPSTIHIGNVTLPLADFCVARTGILGITRSGKTYAAKGIAEQLMDAGIPILVFDAIGVWRHLKTPGDGAGAKGYPVVVAGGESPDLPLNPHSAAEIVRAAMRENVSLVIDLYDAKLSKADWRRIVASCFRTLLYENKTVRHIFLEEAAEYCPQKIMDGEVYAEVEKLARMGGNKGLGLTLINQRAQELNKAVLELCDNLVLMRQRGSHAIDSLEKWLDRASPDTAKEVAKSLSAMVQGDAWVWTEAADKPVRTRTLPIKSFHPDRRSTGNIEAKRPSVDAGKFVARLSGELSKVIEEARANDPAELKRRIAGLEKQLAAKPAATVETREREVPVLTDAQAAQLAELISSVDHAGKDFAELWNKLEALREQFGGCSDLISQTRDAAVQLRGAIIGRTVPVAAPAKEWTRPVVQEVIGAHRPHGIIVEGLAKSHARILNALSWWEAAGQKQPQRVQVAMVAGYTVNGHFNNVIGELKGGGYIDYPNGGCLTLTPEGRKIAPRHDAAPSREDLISRVRAVLKTEPRVKVFDVLVNAGSPVSRDDLASAAGYTVNGHFNNVVGEMNSLGVVEYPTRGYVSLNRQLFGE